MSKFFLSLLILSTFFSACRKENFAPVEDTDIPCLLQTANPAGRSYLADSVVSYKCADKFCGILPLSTKNYWVYLDSIFNNGVLLRVQLDTLRYSTTIKSLADGLVWWEGNLFIGLPETLYANDSAFFRLSDRLFSQDVKDVRKDFSIPSGDSLKYLANFEDAAAQGRTLKLKTAIKTAAGTFNNCVYFEKNAPFYLKDQVYFKPGLGVIKYIQEKAPMGERFIKLQQISTLVAVHIE